MMNSIWLGPSKFVIQVQGMCITIEEMPHIANYQRVSVRVKVTEKDDWEG